MCVCSALISGGRRKAALSVTTPALFRECLWRTADGGRLSEGKRVELTDSLATDKTCISGRPFGANGPYVLWGENISSYTRLGSKIIKAIFGPHPDTSFLSNQ